MTLPAPAKLNLFLHVTGRRPDGYHILQTVFQLLDYGDELTFALRQDGQILLHTDMAGVAAEDNLVIRAARLLQQYVLQQHVLQQHVLQPHVLQAHDGITVGADITLTKRLPAGGGLGGGSSDAATTLLGLAALWQLATDIDTLATLGLTLGADVPVFVRGRTSWAEGIGEELEPLALPEQWFVVVTPPCSVNTAEVFRSEELTRNTSPITIAAFLRAGGHNDCQPVVEKRYPAVKHTIDWLSRFAPCRMTGTGASVFAAFSSETEALEVLAQRPNDVTGFVAKGVNVSPVHRMLERDS